MLAAGRLDVLINNVGTNRRKAALDATAEDFAFLMATNVQSALHLSQLCHPWLAQADGGSIVFNSSVAGGPQAMKSGCMYAIYMAFSKSARLGTAPEAGATAANEFRTAPRVRRGA